MLLPNIATIPHIERDGNYFHTPPTPVPIFQHQFEWEQLLRIYREKRPMHSIEIGTHAGGTLYHLLQNAPAGAVVVSVDSYTAHFDNRHLYADWTPADVTLHMIAGDSREKTTIAAARDFAPYGFVFIDAGHYEHEVQADWEHYGAMAAPGAIVAFHDIITHHSWPSIEVEKVWRRIQRQGYITQELTWSTGVPPNDQGWGGIGLVRMPR